MEDTFSPPESCHTGTVTAVIAAAASSWLAKRLLLSSPKRRMCLRALSPWKLSQKSCL